MAVALYADESESLAPHVFTLAGFIASPSAWERLIPAWREMLCTTGAYPVEALHTNLVDKGNPPFDGWTPAQRSDLLRRAVTLLTDTTLCANLYSISCTFVVEELSALLPGALGDGRTQAIYERCYRVLFHNVRRFSPFAGIELYFDKKAKAEGRVQKHFAWAKAVLDADPELAGTLHRCEFADDRTCVPLQAADLLAFECRRRTWDRLRNRDASVRGAYASLRNGFSALGQPSSPPYRIRLFRCYDHRFVFTLAEHMRGKPQMSETEFLDLWLQMDTFEE